MEWARILAYVTGTVDQELPLRNEYLATENRILKAQLQGRLRFSDAERATLGEIGHRLGRKALGEVATAALPEPLLGCYRSDTMPVPKRTKCFGQNMTTNDCGPKIEQILPTERPSIKLAYI
jgi:hypothetical protein